MEQTEASKLVPNLLGSGLGNLGNLGQIAMDDKHFVKVQPSWRETPALHLQQQQQENNTSLEFGCIKEEGKTNFVSAHPPSKAVCTVPP